MSPRRVCSRRTLLAASAASMVMGWPARRAEAHSSFGPVTPPAAAPALLLNGTDGKPAPWPALLKGRVTAVQLMFTTCSATCPIQGAIFADAQARLLPLNPDLRLLSLSIDPLGDDAKALKNWLTRFGAKPQRWSAAAPRVQDVDVLLDFLRGRAAGTDRHTAQAFLFDRQARLAFRTIDMPAGADLVELMRQLASLR